MIYERIFRLTATREVKVVVNGSIRKGSSIIGIDFEFLIRENGEKGFRPAIGIEHPQYWKLKNYTPEKSQLLQLEYSGISRKQLKTAMREFEEMMGPGFSYAFSLGTETRIRNLKGLRVRASVTRSLSVA